MNTICNNDVTVPCDDRLVQVAIGGDFDHHQPAYWDGANWLTADNRVLEGVSHWAELPEPVKPANSTRADWKSVDAEMPDADRTVLVHVPDDDDPVWFGYFDGECWRNVDVGEFEHDVTHWAELPEPPALSLQPSALSPSI